MPALGASYAPQHAAERQMAPVPRWIFAVVRTSRPRQWLKNLLVFAAPLAGATLGRQDGFAYALVAIVAFGCASAAVYFVNDVADVERDRRHPRKCKRPIAAGLLPKQHAIGIAIVLVTIALSAGVAISEPLLIACVAGYLAQAFFYSLRGKHLAFIELLLVASGFLLRVLGGAAATHVRPSGWFLVVCSLGALGVATAKRYTELTGLGAEAIKHRPVMRFYRPLPLRLTEYAIGLLMIATYLLWASGEAASARGWHQVSAIPLALALIRFGILTGQRTTRPVEDMITRDMPMLACEVAWLALFVAGL